MQAGRLRFRINLEQPTPTLDAAGGEVPGWTSYAEVWADILPMKGRERIAADQIVAEVDTRIIIRWSPSVDVIDAKWRVRHGSVIYNVQYKGHIGLRQRQIELMCQSGVNAG
jgi:SPP1 family predicted phage head-tail adaptor